MGSRLQGNDGRATAHPTTVGRQRAHIVIPRDGGNPGRGEPAMGSRLHGNDGGRRRTPHGRRRRTPHGGRRRTHIVIPATAGIHVGRGACDGFRLHGNDGRRRRTPHVGRQRTPIVIPATAGIHAGGRQGWVPVYTGTTVGRQRAHIVIPATAGIQGGGRQGWVPVYTGTTVGDGAPHTVGGGSPTSSFPRRRAAAHPHRHSRDGGNPRVEGSLRWVPVYTGTTVGDGAPHTAAAAHPHRHSRDGGNPRRGEPAMGSRLHGNDGGRRRTPHGRAAARHIVIPATAGIHVGRGDSDGFPYTRERR